MHSSWHKYYRSSEAKGWYIHTYVLMPGLQCDGLQGTAEWILCGQDHWVAAKPGENRWVPVACEMGWVCHQDNPLILTFLFSFYPHMLTMEQLSNCTSRLASEGGYGPLRWAGAGVHMSSAQWGCDTTLAVRDVEELTACSREYQKKFTLTWHRPSWLIQFLGRWNNSSTTRTGGMIHPPPGQMLDGPWRLMPC